MAAVYPKSLYKRYFVYSAEEEALRKKIYGNNASFGTVMVHGVAKKYTSIVADLSQSKPDAIVQWQGPINKAKYTVPTNTQTK